MEKPAHYIEATILPLDGTEPSRADIAFATSSIMRCVHLVIVEGAEVAVSFPQMTVDEVTSTGAVVRIFGSVLDLAKLLARPDFASLNAGGMFRLGKEAIRPVPNAVVWETYRRVRSVERTFEGFGQREARRRERMEDAASRDARPKQKREKTAFINMRSSSTGDHRFSLFIGKASAGGFIAGKPNSYGLGVTVPSF
ncbi:type I-F CRISPR-associated endoribonuclease Cas6/Csy4 [Sinorhizobium meliloti]|nr:type I-F CRISPR-associated endoribonuclease Cas6/Csy4 [Sinorhizobium meliloti]